jgi:hypothetical protein
MLANNAINSDLQKRHFALLLHVGYDERYASQTTLAHPSDKATECRLSA